MVRHRTVLSAALLLLMLAPAGWADEFSNLVARSRDRDPQERAKAARALGKLDDFRAAQALIALLADRNDYVHDVAVKTLGSSSDREVYDYLCDRALPRSRNPRVLAGVIRVIIKLKLTAAIPGLVQLLGSARGEAAVALLEACASFKDESMSEGVVERLGDRDWRVKAAALEAIASLQGKEATEPLVAACSDDVFQVRVCGLEALEGVDGDRSVVEALRLLADDHWSVRVAAVELIARTGDRTHVPALLQQRREEKGRLRKDIDDALRALAAAQRPDGHEASVVTYYGIQIYSKRVIFVTDISQGMKEPTGRGNGTRISEAQEQYATVLRSYPSDGFFNHVVFATEAKPWKRRMQRATPGSKNGSAAWLKKMVEEWIYGRNTGRTNIYDSLALCFQDPNVDTIVLLTDATSITEGTYRTKTDILRKIGEANRFRKIRFHTIGIGKIETSSATRNMIRELAEDSGGTFLETD